MSYDLAIWPKNAARSNAEALALYRRLVEYDFESVSPDSRVSTFFRELTERNPRLQDADDPDVLERHPWSDDPTATDRHVLLYVARSRAEGPNKK